MVESSAFIPRLWQVPQVPPPSPAVADTRRLLAHGFARARLHELFALDRDEWTAAAGFAIALALADGRLPLMWLRTAETHRRCGTLMAGGLGELGLTADGMAVGVVSDDAALLQMAADAARRTGIGTLVVEAWGASPRIDLTATRRLMLAAETSRVTVLMVRVGTEPRPSAAATRWSVATAPSMALKANAPGPPAFAIECLRRRGGPAGGRWCLEWDRDDKVFRETSVSGADLPLADGGTAARDAAAPLRGAR